jgi:hypothetical protein
MKIKKLTPSEIEELKDDYGFSDEEVKLMEDRLLKGEWKFGSQADLFRVSLAAEPDKHLAGGKIIPGKTVNVQFRNFRYLTKSRDEAKGLYLSQAFRDKRVWDLDEKAKRDFENEYETFKAKVLSDPERLARLKKEFGEI